MKQALIINTQTQPQAVFADHQIAAPMLSIRPAQQSAGCEGDAILFTSRHAPGIDWVKELAPMPCWCVGRETAKQAEENGFTVAGTGEGGVRELAALLPEGQRYIHLGAARPSPNTAPALAGHDVRFVAAYDSVDTPQLNRETINALNGGCVDAVLFLSRRGAENWHYLIEQAGLTRTLAPITALCLSTDMLVSVDQILWQDVQLAAQPDIRALQKLVKERT